MWCPLSRGGGMKGGAKVVIEAHRHEGVFIARSKEDALVTLNSTPGRSAQATTIMEYVQTYIQTLPLKKIKARMCTARSESQ